MVSTKHKLDLSEILIFPIFSFAFKLNRGFLPQQRLRLQVSDEFSTI